MVWGISSIGGGHERNDSWSYVVDKYGRPNLNHLSPTDQDILPCLQNQSCYYPGLLKTSQGLEIATGFTANPHNSRFIFVDS